MKALPALLAGAGLTLGDSALAKEFNSGAVKIHYTVQGKGEPVILVHGVYSSAKMNWELSSHRRRRPLELHPQTGFHGAPESGP